MFFNSPLAAEAWLIIDWRKEVLALVKLDGVVSNDTFVVSITVVECPKVNSVFVYCLTFFLFEMIQKLGICPDDQAIL